LPRIDLWAVFPSTYFARVGEPAAPGDLISYEAVIYAQKGGGADWTFQREGAEIAITLKGRLRVSFDANDDQV
jgi:hypothetical protein